MIIWEGPDRSGKDTLRMALDKKTDYTMINVVRGPIGYITYNRIYNKGQDEKAFIETAKILEDISYILYINVPISELTRRIFETNEKLRGNLHIEEHVKMYERVIEESVKEWGLKNVFSISNDRPIFEVIDEIYKKFI